VEVDPLKKFTKTTWRLLNDRLQMVLAGGTPKWTRKRTFFYRCRLEFQKEWDLIEIDLANPDIAWGTSVNSWAIKHCAELGIKEGRFWEVLSKLNIWPHARGICFRDFGGYMKEVLVNHETKDDMMKDCSFIIVNEKETLNRELWAALNESGYKGTIISMGGHNTGTVQSLAANVADELQRIKAENFYILSLHDFDLDGLIMVMTLRKWLPWVIDIGVNTGFLKFNEIDKDQLIWEARVNKKNIPMLREFIKTAPEYDEEDLAKIHGEKTGPKRWQGKRLELDSVFNKYGIEPFFNYLKEKIKDIKCWDLTRIGIEKQKLDEGDNLYENAVDKLWREAYKAYDAKSEKLSKTFNEIHDTVNKTLKREWEFVQLEKTNFNLDESYTIRWRSLKSEELKDLKESSKKAMTREWVKDYEGKLDEKVNTKLTCWHGDVTEARKDIEEILDEIQNELDGAKEKDPLLEIFKTKLEKIDWGKDELEEIKIPNRTEEIQKVINALHELKMELT